MTDRRISRAIVLAAGTGSRLGQGSPKPLRDVSGIPLLVRVLKTLQSEGVREAVVVTGFAGDRVADALRDASGLDLKLTFVENTRFRAKNGVSLLAAADYVDQECILTMADHLYSPTLVRRLLKADLPEGACAL